ncbi:MAG: hypothetical protein EXR69_05635 [Myxococcales bacterium]|nr:hypothetical protein [Myxococcales bacterium]
MTTNFLRSFVVASALLAVAGAASAMTCTITDLKGHKWTVPCGDNKKECEQVRESVRKKGGKCELNKTASGWVATYTDGLGTCDVNADQSLFVAAGQTLTVGLDGSGLVVSTDSPDAAIVLYNELGDATDAGFGALVIHIGVGLDQQATVNVDGGENGTMVYFDLLTPSDDINGLAPSDADVGSDVVVTD